MMMSEIIDSGRLSMRWVLVVALCAATAAVGVAETRPAPRNAVHYVEVDVDHTFHVPSEDLEKVPAAVRRFDPSPKHIVVFIHGFNTTLNRSHEVYEELSQRVKKAFAARGEKSVVTVGLHWHSEAGGATRWLMKTVSHQLFHTKKDDPYTEKVVQARQVGHRGFRQLMLALKDSFPESRFHVFAHSLGTSVYRNGLGITTDARNEKNLKPMYRGGEMIEVGVACLAGADVDQDQTRSKDPTGGRTQLLWLTTGILNKKHDRALVLRRFVRGRRSIGDGMPIYRSAQLDHMLERRGLVLDTVHIPENHEYLAYYEPERCEHLADAVLTLAEPERKLSPVLAYLDRVLEAPGELKLLQDFLHDHQPSVVLYTLWRMEKVVCGDSQHLGDGTLRRALARSLSAKKGLDHERQTTTCKLIKQGYWPPPSWEGHGLDEDDLVPGEKHVH